MTNVKHALYALCMEYIAAKEKALQQAIADAREAAANETKSSAGDKYETAREMMQQEVNMSLTRLGELQAMKLVMEQAARQQQEATAITGSVVKTSAGNYYIAISAGKLVVDGITYYAISVASPIGGKLMGKRTGDVFEVNGKVAEVREVL